MVHGGPPPREPSKKKRGNHGQIGAGEPTIPWEQVAVYGILPYIGSGIGGPNVRRYYQNR